MIVEIVVLAAAGLAAGFVNAIAGAGSLLTLPALIFTGLDAGAANATNRIAVLFNNLSALVAFRRGGLSARALALPLLLPTAVSGAAGAWAATLLTDRELRLAIAIAMVVFLVLTFVPRRRTEEVSGEKRAADGPPPLPTFRWSMVPGFAAIGFYAGFLQAGVGVLILLYMSLVHGTSLVAANALKVVVILVFTVVALGVFVALGEQIDVLRGLVLAGGTTVGGYLGARESLRRGEKLVRAVLVLAVTASVAKLVWDSL